MSDFLSKFSGKNYEDLLDNDKQVDETGKSSVEAPKQSVQSQKVEPVESPVAPQKSVGSDRPFPPREEIRHPSEAPLESSSLTSDERERLESPRQSRRQPSRVERSVLGDDRQSSKRVSRHDSPEDSYEVDPHYGKKKKRKQAMIIGGALLVVALLAFLYYRFTHVTLPNFVGKPIAEVRAWGVKNNVELTIEQQFSLKHEVNEVIDQAVKPGQAISKGSSLSLTMSQGADPDQVIALPDFANLSAKEAEAWIEKNKADNLQLNRQFNDTVPEGQFIKLEITSPGVTAEDYKRSNRAIVYYSRGKESLEKNIEVPDFAGKQKTEVESWAKSNEVEVTFKDEASATVAQGTVLSQSIPAKEKVAKKDKMEVAVSAGKGVPVPDFGQITPDSASASAPGLTVTVKYQYNPDLGYGALISQSIEAGRQLTEKEDKNIVVIYSEGAPYLKDIRGKNASELAKYFYENYTSKGAKVTYDTYWVDSSYARGTVVQQSDYELTIPMTYHVSLGISNGVYSDGSFQPQQPDQSTPPPSTPQVEEPAPTPAEGQEATP